MLCVRTYIPISYNMNYIYYTPYTVLQVRGVSKSMVVDLGIGIEGMREDELPEAILAQTRFHYVDLDRAAPIHSSSGNSESGSYTASPVKDNPSTINNNTTTSAVVSTAVDVENSNKSPVGVSAQSSFQDLNDPVALRKALNRL